MTRTLVNLFVVVILFETCLGWNREATANPATTKDQAQQQALRRPVDVRLLTPETLLVLNRRSGTVSFVDLSLRRVVSEQRIGKRLAHSALAGKRLWVADEENQLIACQIHGCAVQVTHRLDLPGRPVFVSEHERSCYVSLLWARQLAIVDCTESPRLSQLISLPFAPRMSIVTPDARYLIVADAFGGRLGIIELASRRLVDVRTIWGHNMRGLALDSRGQRLQIAHQMLNESVPTERQRVFWGTLMSNVVRSIKISDLLSNVTSGKTFTSARQPIAHWRLIPLGTPGDATGDPGELINTSQGAEIVALSGVDQIVFRKRPSAPFQRIATGNRPTALAFEEHNDRVYVANTQSDTVSVIDVRQARVVQEISLGPQPELTAADAGELIFYDARLSLDGWFSCHSCHTDGHSNGLLNDNLGDDTSGAPKRVLSLLDAAATRPWGWTGNQFDLSAQIRKSIEHTMHGAPEKRPGSQREVEQLVAFIRTLTPPPGIAAARQQPKGPAYERGRKLFDSLRCSECHVPPALTSAANYDVGLRDELHQSRFNPPSLRGVSQRDRLFHDNRAGSLREVLTTHRHADQRQLFPNELTDLLAYLERL